MYAYKKMLPAAHWPFRFTVHIVSNENEKWQLAILIRYTRTVMVSENDTIKNKKAIQDKVK